MTADRLAAATAPSPDGTRSTAPATLHLARHAQTVWHTENRYAGHRSDIDLTEEGVRQAARLGDWAGRARLDAVVCSPVRRAVETAVPAARAAGHPLEVVGDLREVDFGVAEGATLGELRDSDPAMVDRFLVDPARDPFPGSEAPEAAAARGARALRAVAGLHPGGSVLVVAHNTLLRLAMCALLDLPVSRYRQLFPRLDNGAVTDLQVSGDPTAPASLIALNAPVTSP